MKFPFRWGQIYILPTRWGIYFGLILLLIFFLAYSYSNNLVFGLCFALVSWVYALMLESHFNLKRFKGVKIEGDVFAKTPGSLAIKFSNPIKNSIYNIYFQSRGPEFKFANADVGETFEKETKRKSVNADFARRGVHQELDLRLETQLPPRFFKSWSYVKLPAEVYVYPKPEGLPLSWLVGHRENHGTDDFQEYRSFSQGDNPRRIDWKVFARRGVRLVKDFSSPQDSSLEINWSDLPSHLDFEGKLQQFAKWIVEAEQAGLSYSVRLPGLNLDRAQGSEGRRVVLRHLSQLKESP